MFCAYNLVKNRRLRILYQFFLNAFYAMLDCRPALTHTFMGDARFFYSALMFVFIDLL